jgi:hypothetical protein
MPESAHESRQVTSRRSHRVFIGPINVASYYSGLQAGLRELGTDAELVLFTKHRYLRNALQAKSPKPVVFLDWCVNHVCQVTPSRSPTRTLARILFPFAKALVFLWSLVCCDVFVFAAAKGFYSLYELPFLKLLGKRLIFVFNGSESRPAYLGGAVGDGLSRKPIERMIRRAARQKQRIRWIEKYADVCINHAPQAHFHEKPYIDHCAIGHPVSLNDSSDHQHQVDASDADGSADSVRIVHAPSVCGPKGTDQIRAMIKELQEEGLAIDYVELTGRPNSEVLAELQRCDFVVDELYSDISLAGLGTEAAFFGKAAVVGGYAQETLQSLAGSSRLPMATYVKPHEAKDMIRRLIVDVRFREECGTTAHHFVHETWAPAKMAARFLQLIDGNIPDEWCVRPADVTYLHGFGTTEETRRQVLRKVIAAGGRQSLRLCDKPNLEQALVDFAAAVTVIPAPNSAAEPVFP